MRCAAPRLAGHHASTLDLAEHCKRIRRFPQWIDPPLTATDRYRPIGRVRCPWPSAAHIGPERPGRPPWAHGACSVPHDAPHGPYRARTRPALVPALLSSTCSASRRWCLRPARATPRGRCPGRVPRCGSTGRCWCVSSRAFSSAMALPDSGASTRRSTCGSCRFDLSSCEERAPAPGFDSGPTNLFQRLQAQTPHASASVGPHRQVSGVRRCGTSSQPVVRAAVQVSAASAQASRSTAELLARTLLGFAPGRSARTLRSSENLCSDAINRMGVHGVGDQFLVSGVVPADHQDIQKRC
ncbi:hypothetical protein HNR07_005500 [Nocardiopsis metallicus]|uniref:Uncharacterized protein n=1 Tax=Nocardiopsis metallicus TaxID=179819 RepID=A0A840WG00_9ACTN|nr:hypothetical protein [Nocardiopsis metallicus]